MTGRVTVLHYSAPPVIGGVESVIQAHCLAMVNAGLDVTVIAGRGSQKSIGCDVRYFQIPLMDSQNAEILAANRLLESGRVPENFEALTARIIEQLRTVLPKDAPVIAHNLFTKHFNLPLTAALVRMLDRKEIGKIIAWSHDISWTSAGSRDKVHPGYPWDLIRYPHPQITYVAISRARQAELAEMSGRPVEDFTVVPNGVNPQQLLGLSGEVQDLLSRVGAWQADIIALMPVRITRAKNVEYAMKLTAALAERSNKVLTLLTGPPDPHNADSLSYYDQLLQLRSQLGIEESFRFVYDSGPRAGEPYWISTDVVGELFRVSDLLLMTSHREGFGMPVLEAGLAGIPALTTPIPASAEIAGDLVWQFTLAERPDKVAEMALQRLDGSPTYLFRRLVRQHYTWDNIFHNQIAPLLIGSAR